MIYTEQQILEMYPTSDAYSAALSTVPTLKYFLDPAEYECAKELNLNTTMYDPCTYSIFIQVNGETRHHRSTMYLPYIVITPEIEAELRLNGITRIFTARFTKAN